MILNGSLEVKYCGFYLWGQINFGLEKREKGLCILTYYMSVNSQGTNFEYNNIRDCTIYILIGTEINFLYYRLSNYYIEFSSHMREPQTLVTERLPTPSLHNKFLFKHIT